MGFKPPGTQNLDPFGDCGAARSLRATPPGERNEEFAPWLELCSFSAGLVSGAVAACAFGPRPRGALRQPRGEKRWRSEQKHRWQLRKKRRYDY